MNTIIVEQLNWDKMDNLIPAVIQDIDTLQVLMLGYVSKESLSETIASMKVTFYSRSKKRLWAKGETSGNFLRPVKIISDCDFDAILILVNPAGPTCHLGETSCFNGSICSDCEFLVRLESIIDDRYKNRPENSYTTKLFNDGINRIAQKIGEEGVETALASVTGTKEQVIGEVSDLVYHLFILLRAKDITFLEVLSNLKNRNCGYGK